MAMREVLAELGDVYEQKSGQPVVIVSVGGVDAARRVGDGEAFDFVVLATDAIEKLAADRRVDPGSRTDLARSAVAIAVVAGATRPDISSESATREAVLRARSIGYSTGPSGAHLVRLFERWGIADEVAARIVQASPGVPVGTLVARGDVEIGFQQLSELMHVPGINVVGLLPPEIQSTTVFSAAVCTASNCPAAAKMLLSFLASPQADAAKRRHGMEPA
ncbi:MAG: ABC transporter substrate-binding protein [Betaproteobacteria bacterium]|nr:MAG: ABC transporter substrate-binding protein [Betaproteobacteria bacterium]